MRWNCSKPKSCWKYLKVRRADIDEIKRKTKAELREFIQELQVSLQRIQEQANYWLDAKEQLVMDAEMHNKMIASLVTYAQQQQVAGSKGRKSSFSHVQKEDHQKIKGYLYSLFYNSFLSVR
jgi:hypothetical protein